MPRDSKETHRQHRFIARVKVSVDVEEGRFSAAGEAREMESSPAGTAETPRDSKRRSREKGKSLTGTFSRSLWKKLSRFCNDWVSRKELARYQFIRRGSRLNAE